MNTEGAHAIVMTFFPPLHNPPHPPQTVGDPGDPLGAAAAAAAWNGIVTEAEHQDQRPINRAASLAQKPNGSRQMVISPASGLSRRVDGAEGGLKSQLFAFHRAGVIYGDGHNGTWAAERKNIVNIISAKDIL